MAYRSFAVRLIAAAILFSLASSAPAQAEPRTLGAVAVDFPRGVLPPLTVDVMTREAQRIWSAAGIRLEWRMVAEGESANASAIDVRLVPSDTPSHDGHTGYVMGDAQQVTRSVRVSLGAALRTVKQSRISTAPRPPSTDQIVLGYVLGRVLAHEIGHHLIGPGHAGSGLMRARFRAGDLVDQREGLFEIQPGERARIAARLATGQLSALVLPPSSAPATNRAANRYEEAGPETDLFR